MRIKEILKSDLDPLKKIVWSEHDKYFYTVSFYDSLDNSINICVSSQIGCTERCAFCATASYPFVKNLGQKDLERQYLQGLEIMADFKRKYNPKILFVILEGMGEPTRNLDNCLKAFKNVYPKIEKQFNKIIFKVSTIGYTNLIEKYICFIKENTKSMPKVAFRFQISLHSPVNEERHILIPTISGEISKIIKDFYKLSDFLGSKLLCNYMLLNYPNGETNYSPEHLSKLTSIIIPKKTSIKLTSYSETGKGFSSPNIKVFKEVKKILEKKGIEVELRKLLGSDINAACGMLHYRTPDQVDSG